MINNDRRNFLFKSTMLAASGVLTACGGGAGADPSSPTAVAADPNAADADAQIAATQVTVPNATALPNAVFRLSGSATVKAAPYCLGYAFRRGDVPAGKAVTGDTGTIQVIPKNRWPDGSLKFAVLAGQANVTAGADTKVGLLLIPAPATVANPLKTAKLRATEIVAEIGCGAYGTVSWAGADWDSPFQTWVSGPLMSSWIYRKPVGSDKHLVAWLEVRLWSSGAVEVLPWIENGYLRVAAPTNKSAIFTFSLGKTQRVSVAIDLKHHQRTPLINGTALSYWLAIDPDVTPRHDTAYLQSTELVPSYQAKVDATTIAVKSLVTTFQPLQAGNFKFDQDAMPSGGYQDPIGLLPQHDVLYLTSDAKAAYGAVVRNGYSAGRYGLHYRDENTNRPLLFSNYPTLNIRDNSGFKDTGGSSNYAFTPASTGGNPPQWDVAHSPSVGYMAYLVTGRWYFMEEVQFATTTNYLGNGDGAILRAGSKGLVQTCSGAWQTRSCAWDWRARVQALCVTPDEDTALRAEFIASVEANIEHFHGRYIAQPNNPYGWVEPGEGYDGSLRIGSPWQQDFVTAAFGYSVSLGLPISASASTKLAAFFQWKARSAVQRLGPKGAFWYVNAVPYLLMISPSNSPDYKKGTGPWYESDAAVYNATYATPQAWLGKTDGVLAGEFMPGERALWGNLMPAISYAVRHGVPGAKEAYARILAASNWPQLRDAFNFNPVWAVQPSGHVAAVAPPVIIAPVEPEPAPSGSPVWMANRAVGEWIEIPGTSGAGGAAVFAYSGFAYNTNTNEILIAAAGGHGDSADNRVVSLRLTDNAPVWKQRSIPSSVAAKDTAYYPDGTPTSRHLYHTIHYIPQVNRLMLFGVRFAYGNSHTFNKIDGFNLDTNTWDPAGTWGDVPTAHFGAVAVRSTGEVWSCMLGKWSPVTKTWTQPIKRTADLVRWPIAHDSLRNQLFTLNWGDGEGFGSAAVFATRVPIDKGVQVPVTFNPGAALSTFIAEAPTYCGMDYDPDNDRFLFYCGQGAAAGRVYVIKPNSGDVWDMSLLTLTGSKLPTATDSAGVHSRFRYVPALKGFVMLPSSTSNLFFIRTA